MTDLLFERLNTAARQFTLLLERIQRTMPATPSTATCAPSGNPAGRIGHAEHHRHAAFARQRREVGGAAAAFGHDAGDARQDVTESGPGHTRHEHIARRDPCRARTRS